MPEWNAGIDLDIGWQKTISFGALAEIKRNICTAVSALNTSKGRIMITAGIYTPTRLRNIQALYQATEDVKGGAKRQ